MKNTNYIVSGILAVAVIILFILQLTDKKDDSVKKETFFTGDSVSIHLPVAYVDVDSLLTNFNFYTDLLGDFESKLSKQRSQLNQRYLGFQKEATEFQEKAQNNAFLTRERMEQENTRLVRKQKEIEQAAADLEQEFVQQQNELQKQLSDTLSSAMRAFNSPQKYEMIFTRTGNGTILYANEIYNITLDVIEFLNARYKVEGK
ncbi:MAG: OmpH family outer membrane protein [Candidatus Symbiothrix sp.]|jgi:outer membrane protein|nr:OmpH family outer membrane protein [Candidatus Symbiothrix sp.]